VVERKVQMLRMILELGLVVGLAVVFTAAVEG
jgi:hypothetical protein